MGLTHAGAAEVCVTAQIEKILILRTAPVCHTRARQTHFVWMSLYLGIEFNIKVFNCWGTWIADGHHTWLANQYVAPWAMSSCLSENNSFWAQAQHLCFFMISFDLFDLILLPPICVLNLSLNCENTKLKIKEIYFKSILIVLLCFEE